MAKVDTNLTAGQMVFLPSAKDCERRHRVLVRERKGRKGIQEIELLRFPVALIQEQ